MVTITRYIFINIFQTEHISAVKYDTGYENTKISKSLKKKNVEKKAPLIHTDKFFALLIPFNLSPANGILWTVQ